MRRRLIVALCVAYVVLAVLANWLASAYIWSVPFTHLLAPAGVFCIGAVLVLRDWLQQVAGFMVSVVLVPVAAGLSYAAGEAFGWSSLQRIALASAAAFCVSELLEAAIFQPLRRRSLTAGVLLSGTAGAAVDSYVFLSLAFGSLAFFDGQIVAKGEMILVGVVLTAARRQVLPSGAVLAP